MQGTYRHPSISYRTNHPHVFTPKRMYSTSRFLNVLIFMFLLMLIINLSTERSSSYVNFSYMLFENRSKFYRSSYGNTIGFNIAKKIIPSKFKKTNLSRGVIFIRFTQKASNFFALSFTIFKGIS